MKSGAVVLDVGINVVPRSLPHELPGQMRTLKSHGQPLNAADPGTLTDMRVVGDVAQSEVRGVASALTPVPGGVGPMTIAALLNNVVLAAKYEAGLMRW